MNNFRLHCRISIFALVGVVAAGCGPSAPSGKWDSSEKRTRDDCIMRADIERGFVESSLADHHKGSSVLTPDQLAEKESRQRVLTERVVFLNTNIDTESARELRIKFKNQLVECDREKYESRPKFDPEKAAALREKALGEWDAVINDDIEARMKRLRSAARTVKTVTTGGSRKDAYTMPDGHINFCRTTVNDSGRNMVCDEEL